MITKERLLVGLNELLHVEENVITLYANFSKALVKHTSEITDDKKEKIEKLLSVLYRDSARHRELVNNMIEDVRKSTENEY